MDVLEIHPSESDMNFGDTDVPIQENPPSRHPPAVSNREEVDVKSRPWNDEKGRRALGLKQLPLYSLTEAELWVKTIREFTRDFNKLRLDQISEKVLLISENDTRELVESRPLFQKFQEVVEKTGVLIIDTEGPSQTKLRSLRIPLESSSGMIEVMQMGDLEGNVILFQVFQDCREEHVGCSCYSRCETYSTTRRGKTKFTSPCPTNRGNHASWQNRKALRVHGFCGFPTCISEWLERRSIFIVQSDIACHSGNFGDKERIDSLLSVTCTSWVELHNIQAMFFVENPKKCRVCGEETESEYREHTLRSHGISEFLSGRKCGNGRLFELFNLEDPSTQLLNYAKRNRMRITNYDAPREKEFNQWPRPLLKYDCGDILIVALTLWKCTIDMMKMQKLPNTSSTLEHMRYILHVLKEEPSLTVASAKEGVWPFPQFRDLQDPFNRLRNQVPSYLTGGPLVKAPYPIRNIRQVTIDMADDQYYPIFRVQNIPEQYLQGEYEPMKIADMTKNQQTMSMTSRRIFARLTKNNTLEYRRWDKNKLNSKGSEDSARIVYKELSKDRDPDFWGVCGRCGDLHHKKSECGSAVVCVYPVCWSPNSHALKICRALHHICQACGRRGHRPRDHEYYNPIELKNFFDYFCPWGIFTCLPLLWDFEDSSQKNDSNFKFGYFCVSSTHNYGPLNAHMKWIYKPPSQSKMKISPEPLKSRKRKHLPDIDESKLKV